MLAGPPGLACFDFDNTLIQGDLGESVMYYILMQGLIAGDLPEFWQQLNHPCIAPEDVETWKKLWSIYKDQEDAFSYEKIAHGLIEAYESIAEKALIFSAGVNPKAAAFVRGRPSFIALVHSAVTFKSV
jgi:phosphoserine phosphatase